MSYNKEEMFYFMDACADDLSDGAWQATLEDAAQEWASERSLEIDTYDAFMEYVGWKTAQQNGSDQ